MDLDQKKTAFENVYSELFDAIYRYTVYRVPDTAQAEDIVSEVFLTAYHKLSQYDPQKASLKTWIFQISKRKIIDYWRQKKETVSLKILETFPAESVERADIDHQLLLQKLATHLTSEQKALLALHYIDGLTYEEIAAMTARRPPAIRKIFSRMHAHFRDKLQSYQ